jgi:hypothetical protein
VTPFERKVRAGIYALLSDGVEIVDAGAVAERGGWDRVRVAAAIRSLADQHRIAVAEDESVWMAHPFSGRSTPYRASIGERTWYATCAWDALAILALLDGDGEAHGENGLVWTVEAGRVSPGGLVHLVVPARRFWDDIEFT